MAKTSPVKPVAAKPDPKAAAAAAHEEQLKAERAAKLAHEEQLKAERAAKLAREDARKAEAETKSLDLKHARKSADAKPTESKAAEAKAAEAKVAEAKAAAEKAKVAKAEAVKAREAAKAQTAKAETAKSTKAERLARQELPAAPAEKQQKVALADKPVEAAPAARQIDRAPTASIPPAEETKVSTAAVESDRPEFRWPARGRIIQGFSTGGNDGINIAVPEGTPVKAAEGGQVAYAGSELKGYGNLVLIRHPNGFVTAYAHNGELEVKRGDTVKRGQTIAKSGQSGNVGSPQLHFELRKGSTPVDPTNYLAGL